MKISTTDAQWIAAFAGSLLTWVFHSEPKTSFPVLAPLIVILFIASRFLPSKYLWTLAVFAGAFLLAAWAWIKAMSFFEN